MTGDQAPTLADVAAPLDPSTSVGWWWPALLTVAVAGAFHETLAWLGQQWWKDEYYGHGLLLPLVSAYLIYHGRARLAQLPRRGDRRGLAVAAAALLLHVAALNFGVHFVSGFALVATLWGLSLWLWGPEVARALLFPTAFLLFSVPLSRPLVEKLALPMQLFSAKGAGMVAQSLIGDVTINGVNIVTPNYTFAVAIPCSGLKSLIAMSALGALFAYAVEGPPVRRVILFLASFPIALLANLVRIFATVVLGNTIGTAAAEGFFHTLSGAFVFLLALGGLFALGGALGCHRLRDDI